MATQQSVCGAEETRTRTSASRRIAAEEVSLPLKRNGCSLCPQLGVILLRMALPYKIGIYFLLGIKRNFDKTEPKQALNLNKLLHKSLIQF